jgi:hypothetical protein
MVIGLDRVQLPVGCRQRADIASTPWRPGGFSAGRGWDGDAGFREILGHARRFRRAIRRVTGTLAPNSDAGQLPAWDYGVVTTPPWSWWRKIIPAGKQPLETMSLLASSVRSDWSIVCSVCGIGSARWLRLFGEGHAPMAASLYDADGRLGSDISASRHRPGWARRAV